MEIPPFTDMSKIPMLGWMCLGWIVRLMIKKYKHANDFGISGPYNKQNAAAFKEAILLHVNDPDVIRISDTYKGEPVTHYYNANNGLNVIADSNDNFVRGWKLSPAQEMHVTTIW